VSQLLRVAADLLLEALRRRWFLGLFAAISVVLLLLGLTLRLDVVDGALASSTLFGKALFRDEIFIGQTMLGWIYFIVAMGGFYGGAVFLSLACADFATELLSPGRIEHLLSLPIARWQLLFGTWLGVITLAGLGTLYGAVGLTVLLGLKSGLWSWGLVLGSGLGWVGFTSLYAAMLAVSFFVRSTVLASATGLITLVLGVLASHREGVASAVDTGLWRWAFRALVMPIPRFDTLAWASATIAMGQPVDRQVIGKLLLACLIFSGAALSIATWKFERKDF
jgi:Cu-processing system permease protein